MIAPKLDSGAALGFFWEVFRARPLVFISLSLWWVAVFLVLGVTQVVMTSEEVALLAAAEASGDDAAVLQAMGPYILKILLFTSASMVISVFLETAWLRLFMQGRGNPVFPFRLGAEEGYYLLTMLVLAVAYIFAYVIGGGLIFAIVFGLGAIGGEALSVIALVLGAIAFVFFLLAFLVRVSPALAMAVNQRKFVFARAWNGTREMFWPLFGCYLLAVIIGLVLYMVAAIVMLFLPGGMAAMTMAEPVENWRMLIVPFLVLYSSILIPLSMMRGIACKAALTIEEANATPPPAPTATVNGGDA